MSDLGSQIRYYIDDIAPAIPLDDVQRAVPVADAIPTAARSRSRARWMAPAAAIACVAVLGAALAVRSANDPDHVDAGPGTTIAEATEWDWLEQFGTEVPPPAVPAGWQTLDFGEVRFAVPGDWVVPISRSCAPAAPGVVLVSNGVDPQSSCGPEEPLPASVLTIESDTEQVGTGEPAKVGTLPATFFDAPDCRGCLPVYSLANGYLVTVAGPESQRILDTFTESGTRRVLQSGDEADTTDWQSVDYEGLSLLVPAEWDSIDLPSYSEQQTENGARVSGYRDPGSCGGAMFPSDGTRLFLGTSLNTPSCPGWSTMDLTPGDGIWIRSGEDASVLTDEDRGPVGAPLAHGEANGLGITVLQVDRLSSRTPSPVLDLRVRNGETVHWISLGVGLDTSVARSILHSLRASGTPVAGDPSTEEPSDETPTTPSTLPAGWVGYMGPLILEDYREPDAPQGYVMTTDESPIRKAVYDQPDGQVIGYAYSNLGFLPIESAESFDDAQARIERWGCDTVLDQSCTLEAPQPNG